MKNGNLDNTYEITRTQIDKNGQALKERWLYYH